MASSNSGSAKVSLTPLCLNVLTDVTLWKVDTFSPLV